MGWLDGNLVHNTQARLYVPMRHMYGIYSTHIQKVYFAGLDGGDARKKGAFSLFLCASELCVVVCLPSVSFKS